MLAKFTTALWVLGCAVVLCQPVAGFTLVPGGLYFQPSRNRGLLQVYEDGHADFRMLGIGSIRSCAVANITDPLYYGGNDHLHYDIPHFFIKNLYVNSVVVSSIEAEGATIDAQVKFVAKDNTLHIRGALSLSFANGNLDYHIPLDFTPLATGDDVPFIC